MEMLLYWFAKAIVTAIQALPLEMVARFGRAGGAFACMIDRRHRAVAKTNLQRCFPEKSGAEIHAIVREHFRRLGENYASAIKTAGMSFEQVLARCEVVGLAKLGAAERGSFIGPHQEFATQGSPGAAPSNHIVAIG